MSDDSAAVEPATAREIIMRHAEFRDGAMLNPLAVVNAARFIEQESGLGAVVILTSSAPEAVATAWLIATHVGGVPRQVDWLSEEAALEDALDGIIGAAHDLDDDGTLVVIAGSDRVRHLAGIANPRFAKPYAQEVLI